MSLGKLNLTLFLSVLAGCLVAIGWGHPSVTTSRCEFYNSTCDTNECYDIEDCTSELDRSVHCYALWKNDSNGNLTVQMKGCFLHNNECRGKYQCVERKGPTERKDVSIFFCCCDGDMCNNEFSYDPDPAVEQPTLSTVPVEPKPGRIYSLVGYAAIGIVFAGTAVVIYFCYRNKKASYFNEVPTCEPNPLPLPSATGACLLRPIQLIEVKARGRFGAVWKAQYSTDIVAVKVFPIQDKQSWMSEQQIFRLPRMDHDNVLRYLGAEKRGDNLQAEFWLVTAYHENGSLCDFLKGHTLTWHQLCRVAESMARGLMHLHEEVAPVRAEGFKPAIAHRDFKSKNVLLKSDLTACIADFGLALVFQPGKPCGDTHGQVGTRRYMAPEVLEGAINFSRDAFLRIDMYACGLVLWELASRCTAQEGQVGEYRLPFEEEVGSHPSLEDMQDLVVHKKQRPLLRNDWKSHQGLRVLCDTMEDCWDHDAEARLSASCVMERIASQTRLSTLQPLLISDIANM